MHPAAFSILKAGELGTRSTAGSWSGRAMETPPPFQKFGHCDVCRWSKSI